MNNHYREEEETDDSEDVEECFRALRTHLLHQVSIFKEDEAALMVLDNVEAFVYHSPEFGSILNDLQCHKRILKLLVVASVEEKSILPRKWVNNVAGPLGYYNVSPLNEDASSTFLTMNLSRVITKSELKLVPDAAIMTTDDAIKKHPVFKKVTGNPRRILKLATLLSQTPLDNVVI